MRKDFIMDEGKPGRHDERPRARDNFDPRPPFGGDPKMVRALADDIFMDGKMQLHAGADTESGLGPGLVPTSEASRGGDDIFAEGRAREHSEKDTHSWLEMTESGVVPGEGAPVQRPSRARTYHGPPMDAERAGLVKRPEEDDLDPRHRYW
jgi:hypothetical protein